MRSIHIEVSGSTALPAIWCDRLRVVQVLVNLVGNAIKFAPAGSAVELRASPGTHSVTFAVADRGPGIPADQLPHLFERYWISRGIVVAHGGRIWVESEVGRGSTFCFSMPLAGDVT